MERTKLRCYRCDKLVDSLKSDKSTDYRGVCLSCYLEIKGGTMLTDEEKEKFKTLIRNNILGISFYDIEQQKNFALKMIEYFRLRIEVFDAAMEKMIKQRDYKSKQANDGQD